VSSVSRSAKCSSARPTFAHALRSDATVKTEGLRCEESANAGIVRNESSYGKTEHDLGLVLFRLHFLPPQFQIRETPSQLSVQDVLPDVALD
jgi:hypothetical protein